MRDRGIEPLSSVWKTDVLPLNESRVCILYTNTGANKNPLQADFCSKTFSLEPGALFHCILQGLGGAEFGYAH